MVYRLELVQMTNNNNNNNDYYNNNCYSLNVAALVLDDVTDWDCRTIKLYDLCSIVLWCCTLLYFGFGIIAEIHEDYYYNYYYWGSSSRCDEHDERKDKWRYVILVMILVLGGVFGFFGFVSFGLLLFTMITMYLISAF